MTRKTSPLQDKIPEGYKRCGDTKGRGCGEVKLLSKFHYRNRIPLRLCKLCRSKLRRKDRLYARQELDQGVTEGFRRCLDTNGNGCRKIRPKNEFNSAGKNKRKRLCRDCTSIRKSSLREKIIKDLDIKEGNGYKLCLNNKGDGCRKLQLLKEFPGGRLLCYKCQYEHYERKYSAKIEQRKKQLRRAKEKCMICGCDDSDYGDHKRHIFCLNCYTKYQNNKLYCSECNTWKEANKFDINIRIKNSNTHLTKGICYPCRRIRYRSWLQNYESKWRKKRTVELHDSYLRHNISQKFNCSYSKVTQPMIQFKRIQLLLKRAKIEAREKLELEGETMIQTRMPLPEADIEVLPDLASYHTIEDLQQAARATAIALAKGGGDQRQLMARADRIIKMLSTEIAIMAMNPNKQIDTKETPQIEEAKIVDETTEKEK